MPFRNTVLPILSSRTLSWVGLCALMMAAYSLLSVWKEYSFYRDWADMPSDMHAALSLVLGCLLVFRTNTAYSRWWEARTLWGSLVNCSRNLAIKICTLGQLSRTETEACEPLIRDFPRALMHHLRSASTAETNNGNPGEHQPMRIAHELYSHLAHWHRRGQVTGDELRALDMELARLMDICGACERIARTPIIRSYKVFARQCIALFLITLPWGIAQDFRWWTVPLTMIVSYFMIGLETVAEHVEEPFGLDEDDLDLEGLCGTIEKSVREVFARSKR